MAIYEINSYQLFMFIGLAIVVFIGLSAAIIYLFFRIKLKGQLSKKELADRIEDQVKAKRNQEFKKLEKEFMDSGKYFQEVKHINPLFYKRKKNFRYWKERILNKWFKHDVMLIRMQLTTNRVISFIAKPEGGAIRQWEKRYILDDDMKYLDVNTGYTALNFHEDIAAPIEWKWPIQDIKKGLAALKGKEAELRINPATIDRFIEAKIAEGITKGEELDKALKFIKLLLIIVAVIAAGHAILYMQKSGVFSQVGI